MLDRRRLLVTAASGALAAAAAPLPSAPANVSSERPSGSGITAASVRAGGPPTKMFTRKGTPARRAAA